MRACCSWRFLDYRLKPMDIVVVFKVRASIEMRRRYYCANYQLMDEVQKFTHTMSLTHQSILDNVAAERGRRLPILHYPASWAKYLLITQNLIDSLVTDFYLLLRFVR